MARPSINRSTRNITVGRDVTPQILAAFNEAMKEVVDTACQDCAQRAKDNLSTNGSVDTGALKASVYFSVPDDDGFPAAVALARALRPGSDWFDRPRSGYGRVEINNDSYYAGFVAVAAEYGRYIEQGKVHQPPKPFLAPAIAVTNREFRQKAADIINRLLGNATS
jgi:hypothetical protein